MTDAGISPDPAADDGADESSRSAPWPDRGADESSRSALGADHGAALSDEDLLALLDSLGVAGTHDPEEHQEAIADAEWEALQAYDFGADDEDGEGRAVSPVLVGEHLPAGPGLAAVLAQDPPAGASDWDLPGLAAGYRRLAAWAQARELSACAEIAARRAAANPKIGTCEDGRPASLPPEAAAEVGLELSMTQPGASAWTALACQLRWALPLTGDALAAGTIDLGRARIIADATVFLTRDHASQVEARVVPAAGRQTTGQLRAAVRRAVLAIDPDGAEQRQRDTERSAKLALYPGEEGTATLTGSCLPGLEAAAAMARITAMARAEVVRRPRRHRPAARQHLPRASAGHPAAHSATCRWSARGLCTRRWSARGPATCQWSARGPATRPHGRRRRGSRLSAARRRRRTARLRPLARRHPARPSYRPR